MNAEQKYKLAKVIIITMALVLTTILVVYMVLEHNPQALTTILDLQNQKVEMYCNFAGK